MEWTTFQNKYATTATAVEGTLQDFFNMLRDAGPYKNKDMCKWVKLARFGEKRTADNSLRHNGNVLAITGVEGDYDGELIQPEEVIQKLEAAQIRAIVYTSPSYTPEKPRWRVIAPCSKEMPTAWRDILLSRINGVLGGILANESFTLSQSYYFGQVEGVEYRVLATFDDPEDGHCIDDLPMLDDIAIGKKNAPQTAEDAPYSQDTIAKKVQELGRKLRTGDGRRELLKSHIASASGRGIRTEADLMTLVHGVAAQFFDPADPFDPKDVGEIVGWAAGRDKAAAAEAARMVAGLMRKIEPAAGLPIEKLPEVPPPYPGAMAEIVEASLKSAFKPQPALATLAALVGMAACINGEYSTHSGGRFNLYGVGVLESGGGKDNPRVIGEMVAAMGKASILGRPASGAGMEDVLEARKNQLVSIDEMAHILQAMNDDRSPAHLRDIAAAMLKLYSASGAAYNRRILSSGGQKRADFLHTSIPNPCVSVLGFATPSGLGKAFTEAKDGVQNPVQSPMV